MELNRLGKRYEAYIQYDCWFQSLFILGSTCTLTKSTTPRVNAERDFQSLQYLKSPPGSPDQFSMGLDSGGFAASEKRISRFPSSSGKHAGSVKVPAV